MFEIDKNSSTPPYLQLADLLKEAIVRKRYLEDDPLPSVRSIVGETGLSLTTVQRAFHTLQNEGLIYAKPGKGNFVASRKHLINCKVHLFLPKMTLSFWGLVLEGIYKESQKHSLEIVIHSLNTDKLNWDQSTLEGIETAVRENSMIIFMEEAFGEIKKACIDAASRIPLVTLEWKIPGAGSVVNDYSDSILNLFIKAGISSTESVLVLKGRDYQYNVTERMKAFHLISREFDWQLEKDIFFRDTDFDAYSGYSETISFLEYHKPDWIICANDYEAMGAIGAAVEKGLLPGRDIRIVGYGDMIDRTTSYFPVTTVSQNLTEMGRAAVQSLINLYGGSVPEQIIVKTDFIKRKT